MPSPRTVKQYSYWPAGDSPYNIYLLGSNDGSTFTTLDIQYSVIVGFSTNYIVNINNTMAYSYYRLSGNTDGLGYTFTNVASMDLAGVQMFGY